MDKNVLKNISYGLYVIGWQDEIKGGCIVNTVMQITSEPLLLLLALIMIIIVMKLLKKQVNLAFPF